MATYLVTGVAGFVGRNLARALLERGDTVRGIDNFATGRRSNLEGLDGLTLVEGDITNEADIDQAMEGAEYVLHEAAIPSVARSVDAPMASHHANVTGTLSVLEAARRAGTVRRVVYAASSSAYGDTPVLPKVETMTPMPLSPYAVNKLTGEHYMRVYARVFGLSTVSLRYFNVFGPYQDPDSTYAAVIPKFVRCALTGERPPIHGDGHQTRDFTYIDNVIEANLKACTAEGVDGEVFNVACGERIDLIDLLQAVQDIVGRPIEPIFEPPRAGDVRDSLADVSKARALLGYEGAVTLRDGLERAIGWYRENLV